MPSFGPHPGDVSVNLILMRHYLRTAPVASVEDLLRDAFVAGEDCAATLLVMTLGIRGNRRTRKTLADVRQEWWRVTNTGAPVRPHKWYVQVTRVAFAQFQQWRAYAFPREPRAHQAALTHGLSRAQRRMLRFTAVVEVELPTLREQAGKVATELWGKLQAEEAVLWVDNWYLQRFSPDPANPVRSLNVSVFGILFLESTRDAPAGRTRSNTLGTFGGYHTLSDLVRRVEFTDARIGDSLRHLCGKVMDINQVQLTGKEIRVPLDVHRAPRPARQWRGLMLSPKRVGTNTELVRVLEEVATLQRHSNKTLPLLVDEKVHYSVMRLLYSQTYRDFGGRRLLQQVPMLYGAWHPYKHCLTLVWRSFWPVIGLLDTCGTPAVGTSVKIVRKVVYMERMVAALLMLPKEWVAGVRQRARDVTAPHTQHNAVWKRK